MKKRMKCLVALVLSIMMIFPTSVPARSKVRLNKTSLSLCKGNQYRLKISGTRRKVRWYTSNKSIVSVSSRGTVKGRKSGSAVITAKVSSKKYRCKVTVLKAALNKTSLTLGPKKKYRLKVSGTSRKIRWASLNKKVAKVSRYGTVSAVKKGTTTVRAYIGNGYLNCKVKILDHNHVYTSRIVRKSTCTGKGIMRYTCKKCKYYYDRSIAALGHSWDDGEIVEVATSARDGKKRYTCERCGATTYQAIPKKGQDMLQVDKESYTEGEPIKVTAYGVGSDWVGIYSVNDSVPNNTSILWYNIAKDGQESGKTYTIQETGIVNKDEDRLAFYALPEGEYKIILFKDGGYDVVDSKIIKVEKGTRLTTDKSEYQTGEDIKVTATGYKDDWVAIYKKEDKIPDQEAIYWYYTAKDGQKSGEAYAIQKNGRLNESRKDMKGLLPGDYKIILFGNGGYTSIAEKEIKISGDVPYAKAPLKADYQLKNETDGLADGVVNITLEENSNAKDIVMYWADDQGALDGYTALAKSKVLGTEMKVPMVENTMIPENATRLLVYTQNAYGRSKDFAEIKLPENAGYKMDSEPVSEFQVLSDVHITKDGGNVGDMKFDNEHFQKALEDIAKTSTESAGIFIAGDMADTGNEQEYINMKDIISKVSGLPTIYRSIGNHDLMNGSYEQQAALFKKYAGLESSAPVYYDKEVNGYHYIMLGSEKTGLHAYLSAEQLEWLDQKLAEDTKKDPAKPVFVLLHQSISETVAGSFEGQGWNGVDEEERLKEVLKKYPQVVMFNGHSHWELNSTGCMYKRTTELPTIFNTAATGYLWTSYNKVTGEYLEGSQGYYIRVYKDKIVVQGRDFVNGKWIPSASFLVENYQK